MKILGVDYGTKLFAVALFEDKKVIYTATFYFDSFEELFQKLSAVYQYYKPEKTAAEATYFGLNAKTGIQLSKVLGVIHLTAEINGSKVTEVVSKAGKAIVGATTKESAYKQAKKLFGEEIVSNTHIADAILVGYYLLKQEAV